ncbi:MAG: phosphate ABC transporter permease PstA [Myxococcota bacterium]
MTPERRDRVANRILGLAPVGVLALVAFIVGDVVLGGLGKVDWAFLSEGPRQAGREGGIAPMLVATGWVLLIGVGSALPVGLGAAIHLAEFGRSGLRVVRGALDLLSAVPSVVYGLFGLAFFCEALGLGWSVLSGGLTVALMILPLFVRLSEAGLRAVPDRYRAAGLALGLPRWMLLRRVLLPQAAPAIAAALVLATGRVLAESAVFLFTAGASTRLPEGPGDPGRVLAVHVYLMAVEVPGGGARAAATAVVLLAGVLASAMAAQALPRLFLRRGAA